MSYCIGYIIPGKPGRDLVPDGVRLRETVQQQHRRALPAAPKANVDAIDVTMFGLEAGKQHAPHQCCSVLIGGVEPV